MFRSWNILDSGLTRDSSGHHHWENKLLAHELVRRGETVRIMSHRHAPSAEIFAGVEIVRAFSVMLYSLLSPDPAWSTIENFILHNRAFRVDLCALDTSLFRDSVALFPTVGERQLLGVLKWLGSFPNGARPKTAICLRAPEDFSRKDTSSVLYAKVWKSCPPELRADVALFARTPTMATMFGKKLGMPAHPFPFMAPEELLRARSHASEGTDEMVLSFVGGTRTERGSALIPDIVKQCAVPGVRFRIYPRDGDDRGVKIDELSALSRLPHVEIKSGVLAAEDYYRAIAEGVVLLPYEPRAYRWRDSGVYHEAKLLDSPVLVTAGTWIAEEVKALGNGLVIENFSAAAVVDCIARARRALPELREAAARVGEAFRKTQGVARTVEAVENVLTGV